MTGDDPPGGRPSSGAGVKVLGGRTQEVVADLWVLRYFQWKAGIRSLAAVK